MPRISAPTVAEHRAKQRDALVGAALGILLKEGLSAVTPAAGGAASGLARASVYQYFPSSAELVAAVVESAFPVADAQIRTAMGRAETPEGRIDAFLTASLDLAVEPAHRASAALASADLPEPCRARLVELHRTAAEPLVLALTEAGAVQPVLTAQLIGGLLNVAMRAINAGADQLVVSAHTLHLARAAVAAGCEPSSGS